MPLFGTVTEHDFRENIQSTERYTNDAAMRSEFFLETRLVTVPRFGFFQNSRIRIKDFHLMENRPGFSDFKH